MDASATAQKHKCPDKEETAGMCANCCGFFGAAATGNMCSKCYLGHVTGTVHTMATSTGPPGKKAKMIVAVPSSDGAAAFNTAAAVDSSVASVKQPPVAANRCATCRKKVGLLGFRCRCEGTFCSVHRYSEKHDCGFDYKTAGQEQIAKHNPVGRGCGQDFPKDLTPTRNHQINGEPISKQYCSSHGSLEDMIDRSSLYF